jgi:hypothetical protein
VVKKAVMMEIWLVVGIREKVGVVRTNEGAKGPWAVT